MRKHYKEILKTFFHTKVSQARYDMEISQEEMAYRLAMACRNYVDLDNGKTCCSAVTLALFLIYICKNPVAFLEELRHAFEADSDKAA